MASIGERDRKASQSDSTAINQAPSAAAIT